MRQTVRKVEIRTMQKMAPPPIALFCEWFTAWLPPLTILWTLCAHDLGAVAPKIVKDGTPDQRALLQVISEGWVEIRNPKSEIRNGWAGGGQLY